MRDGFIKVAAVTPKVVVADPVENTIRIKAAVMEAAANGAKVIVCPELCITGYTCGDLFLQETLLRSARERLVWLAKELGALDAVVFVGLPLMHEGKLYNVAAALNKARLSASCQRPIFQITMNSMKQDIFLREKKKQRV